MVHQGYDQHGDGRDHPVGPPAGKEQQWCSHRVRWGASKSLLLLTPARIATARVNHLSNPFGWKDNSAWLRASWAGLLATALSFRPREKTDAPSCPARTYFSKLTWRAMNQPQKMPPQTSDLAKGRQLWVTCHKFTKKSIPHRFYSSSTRPLRIYNSTKDLGPSLLSGESYGQAPQPRLNPVPWTWSAAVTNIATSSTARRTVIPLWKIEASRVRGRFATWRNSMSKPPELRPIGVNSQKSLSDMLFCAEAQNFWSTINDRSWVELRTELGRSSI